MASLKITILGTGTSGGVPMIGCDCEVCSSSDPRDKRLRTSVMIASETTRVVIDTGPDFRFQMLRTNTRHVDAILFTHAHKDHTAGLDDVRAYNYFSGRKMDVYANQMTEDALRRDYYYAFADDKYPGTPELEMHTIDAAPFVIGDLEFIPIEVRHLKMPVWGYRVGDFTYITDANYIEPGELEKIKGSRVLVLNALRKEKHVSHFCLDEAIGIVQALGIPEAYFTHISHQMGLHKDVLGTLPQGLHLAYDGMMIDMQ